MHSGGIRAVAIATPGITLDFSRRVMPMMPARPPVSAISTSHRVGVVRASSSDRASSSGVTREYRVEVTRLMAAAMPRFSGERRISAKS